MRTDAERFGRRQPWLIGLTTVGLGFAAARLLRASDIERARPEEALRATAMTTPPVHPPATGPAQPVVVPPPIPPASPGVPPAA